MFPLTFSQRAFKCIIGKKVSFINLFNINVVFRKMKGPHYYCSSYKTLFLKLTQFYCANIKIYCINNQANSLIK